MRCNRRVGRLWPALLVAFLGCDDATGPELEPASLSLTGWMERGAVAAADLRRGATPLSLDEATLSASPSDAVAFLGNGQLRFLRTGTVEIVAELDGETARTSVEVGLPPFILFDQIVGGNRDIYRMRLDGTEVVRLTSDAAEDAEPTAGGGAVVFTSRRDGNAELYRIPSDDTAPERLTTTPDAEEREPALTRDGTAVAYARTGDGDPEVWTSPLPDWNPARLTDGLGSMSAIEGSPSWSPEADRLALMSTAGGDADVWIVTAQGDPGTLLAGESGPEVEPAWHPTEDRVVLVATMATGDAELFLVDLTDGETTRLTNRLGIDGQPAWLPDGRVVFTAWEGTTRSLRWLDPAEPGRSWEILTGATSPANPAGVY